jgi:hypothetical protein
MTFEKIGIDEVRALTMEAHRRPQATFITKTVVIYGLSITSEAQQAALKILEEPPKDSAIIMVLPTGTQILPTILSRVSLEILSSEVSGELNDWLQLSHADRIAEVDTRVKAKDQVWMSVIKSDLQQYLSRIDPVETTHLKESQLVVNHLLTRGASNKMLLEHLALVLPLRK